MSLFRAHHICLSLGSRTIFDELDLTIEPGECVGLIGVNGSGKSTLLQIAAGLRQPDQGLLEQRKGARFAFLPQDPSFEPGMTMAKLLFEPSGALKSAIEAHAALASRLETAPPESQAGLLDKLTALSDEVERLGGWQCAHHAKAILQRLGVSEADWTRPLEELSGGQKKRAAIAQALLTKPDLLLLDEPTNHLDVGAVDWLEGELDAFEGAILLVTHDRYFLDRLAERIVELDHGRLTAYPGNFSAYLEQKIARQALAARQEHKRQRLIAQELAWLRTGPKARRTKRKSRVDAARALIAQKPPAVDRAAAMRLRSPVHCGHRLLEARHLCQGFGDRRLVQDLSLILEKGERIGIIGPNGAGKTTLLRTLIGDLAPQSGEIVRGKHLKVAYFDQTRASLDPDETVFEAMGTSERFEFAGRAIELTAYLEDLLFPAAMQRMKVGALSGGEKNRLLLARLFLSGANLLVLDEPTNDLDLTTLAVLEDKLIESGAALLLVTHDRCFLDRIATSILALDGHGRADLYPGNHEMFLRLSSQSAASARASDSPSVPAKAPRPLANQTAPQSHSDEVKSAQADTGDRHQPRDAMSRQELSRQEKPIATRRLTIPEWKRLEAMEGLIEEAEARRSDVETRLSDPALYRERPCEVPTLERELAEATAQVERLYEEWQLLETRSKLG